MNPQPRIFLKRWRIDRFDDCPGWWYSVRIGRVGVVVKNGQRRLSLWLLGRRDVRYMGSWAK